MGIRKDLLVTEEIAESSDLRATPFEFERAKSVEAALSILEGKWKIVILNRLFARPVWRFSELERAVPGHFTTYAVPTAASPGEVRVGEAHRSSSISAKGGI